MMRSDAHKLLADYTKRVKSNHELRRRRTQQPLWADSYDAAAACNQKREAGFDQADQIFINFQELTEMLLKVKSYFKTCPNVNILFRVSRITRNSTWCQYWNQCRNSMSS